jgi:hypothetical protein
MWFPDEVHSPRINGSVFEDAAAFRIAVFDMSIAGLQSLLLSLRIVWVGHKEGTGAESCHKLILSFPSVGNGPSVGNAYFFDAFFHPDGSKKKLQYILYTCIVLLVVSHGG